MIRSKTVSGIIWVILAMALQVWPGAVGTAHGQGSRKDDIVFNSRGVPLAGATVRVCAMPATGQPCTPLALIYSDAALTQALANPTATDGLGNYNFYAAPGKYEIEISGPGIITKQIPNVILPSDPSAPTFNSISSTGGISAFSLSLTGNLTVNGSTTVVGNLASGTLTLSNQGTAPGTASAGTVNLYTKSTDKRLYYKDETGTEVGPIASGSGAQTNTPNTFTAPQNVDADFHTKGPNPSYDVLRYGGYIGPNYNSPTTGSISSGGTALTLAAASDFANGHGILILGAGPAPVIATPQASAVTPIAQTGATSYSYCVVDTDWFGGRTGCSPAGTTSTGFSAFGLQSYTISNWARASGVITLTTSAVHNIPLTTYNNAYPQAEVLLNSTNNRQCEGAFSLTAVPSTTTVQFTQYGVPDSATCTGGTLRVLPRVVLKWDAHATYNVQSASCAAGVATVTVSPGLFGPNGTWVVPFFARAVMAGITDTHYNITSGIGGFLPGAPSNPTSFTFPLNCSGVTNVGAGGTMTLVPGKAVKNALIYRCAGASCALPANAANYSLVGVAEGNDGYFVDNGWGATAAAIDLGDAATTAPTAATNQYLSTTISGGGGTTALTLATTAANTVSAKKVFHDNTPNLLAACAAIPVYGDGINFNGGHIVIPAVATSGLGFQRFPIASNFDTAGNYQVSPRNCPGTTIEFRSQPELFGSILVASGVNFISDLGSTNCQASFYAMGAALACVTGFSYPMFYFEPEQASNNFFQNLVIKPQQNYQSGLYYDEQLNGDGVVAQRYDHVHVNGGSKSYAIVDKTGFGRFWDYGGWSTGGGSGDFSTNRTATFTLNCGQPIYNLYSNTLTGIMYTRSSYLFGTAVVDVCGQPSINFQHASFKEQLSESSAGPAWLINGPIRGISFDSGSYADFVSGYASPYFDLTNASASGVTFVNNGCGSGYQPLLQTGTSTTAYGGINITNPSGGCSFLGVQNYENNDTQNSVFTNSSYNTQLLGSSQIFSPMAAPGNFQSVTQLGAGNVPVGSYTYCLTASDALGGETVLSSTCTTINVITQSSVVQFVLPAAFPAGASGVNLYISGTLANANACAKPQFTDPGGTHTYNFSFTCGNSPPTATTAASAALTAGAIAAPKLFLNGEAQNAAPRSEQNLFLPGALTSTWTASTWTPDKGVTITRIQVQPKTAPAGCTTNAVVRLTDGTTPLNVTVSAAANDSGALAQNYAAGASLTVSVQTAAAGCGTAPADANVTIQYRMQ